MKNLIYFVFFILQLLAVVSCNWDKPTEISSHDRRQIRYLEDSIAMILPRYGWEEYESVFDKDYTNWYMESDGVRERQEFLDRVQSWFDDGNSASSSRSKIIDMVPLDDNMVLCLSDKTEIFASENSDVMDSVRFQFVSIYKKVDGQWKLYFTAFK